MRHRLESSEIWTGLALAQPSSSHSRRTQTAHGRFMHSNRRITSCIFINMQLGYSFVSFPSTPLVSIITAGLSPANLLGQSPPKGPCFNVHITLFLCPGKLCLRCSCKSVFSHHHNKRFGHTAPSAARRFAPSTGVCSSSSSKNNKPEFAADNNYELHAKIQEAEVMSFSKCLLKISAAQSKPHLFCSLRNDVTPAERSAPGMRIFVL